jgi:hypothetical protein
MKLSPPDFGNWSESESERRENASLIICCRRKAI